MEAAYPRRVMSLLPSATEIMCGIPGGKQLLVARSSEDVYPSDISHLPTVIDPIIKFTSLADIDRQVSQKMKDLGTLYVVDKQKIISLQPDLILTQDLCRVCSVDLMTVERIAAAMHPRPVVLNLSPVCLEDLLDNITEVGEAAGLQRQSLGYRQSLEARIAHVKDVVAARSPVDTRPRVLTLDWVNPFIVGGHWMPQMVDIAGGVPLLNPLNAHENGRSHGGKAVKVSGKDIVDARPDIVVIAACGLSLDTLRKEIAALRQCAEWLTVRQSVSRIVLCDGSHYFNRPGPRLVDSLEFIAGFINGIPDLIPKNIAFEELGALE
ncbi:hypothetical protein J3B02_001680 [Coemansia erecta]|uniref:Fe/B12 periplasmic-binding domain-containing protein n=1 Tax=Coemansia asiatica TaxID=1052880 RepID=A0A9W8CL87_9FUNG|nr:hypothetical protein LPJ64_000781 [Coemansia asiatica]KAJ2856303.1 hypothetical protein J3B02_001680 [Coemansia erecta]KAJ2888162.1 hypothetical protein FB639_000834 [Coemansia asiatica]